jgi:hypothetical protein
VPIPRSAPVNWRPKGITGARDGTNSFSGAMRRLINMIPDPSTQGVWVCRPAAQEKTDFTDGPAGAGILSGAVVVGDLLYGMVASTLNPGFDEPFCYDLSTDTFITVSGITSGNVPTSPPASGAWTPPILCRVASRTIVTHPGFPGTGTAFSTTTTGNTDGTNRITGNPDILGVTPGMSISGTGIPAGATVVAVEYFQLNTTGDTHTNTTLDNLASTNGVKVGQGVGGLVNFAAGTTVAALVGSTVTLSVAATGTAAGQDVTFTGAVITISAPTTATADGVTLTIAGGAVKFGWFDVSGFTEASTLVNSTSGSQVLTGGASVLGVQPGMMISGTNIPANTSVLATAEVVVTTAATLTIGAPNFPVVSSRGIFPGMGIAGQGIPDGTFVTAVLFGGSRVTPSQDVTDTGTFDLTFTGSTITMSAAATGTQAFTDALIEGGTLAAPLWGAGDTDRNPLPSVPVGVAQMNGRAWYALGTDGIIFSDSGFPCRVSNTIGVQALTTGDGLAVTAIGQQQLSAPLLGGIVQGLIAFEGVSKLQQITGDQATGNLSMNVLPEATGTEAPLSVVSVGGGRVAFISPLGLRFVALDGTISQPVGVDGQGITDPFQFAVVPSRICATYNVGVLRITVQNGLVSGDPVEEYWFDLPRQAWHGPHTFPARLIQPWGSTFIVAPIVAAASLWRSDAFQTSVSSYTENGNPLSFFMETVLLPDNATMAMNAIVEGSLMCAASSTEPIQVTAFDEIGGLLGIAETIAPNAGNEAVRQRSTNWDQPLIFKQMRVRMTGLSGASVRIGNLYQRYEILGYNLDEATAGNFWLLSSRRPYPILLADDGVTGLIPG